MNIQLGSTFQTNVLQCQEIYMLICDTAKAIRPSLRGKVHSAQILMGQGSEQGEACFEYGPSIESRMEGQVQGPEAEQTKTAICQEGPAGQQDSFLKSGESGNGLTLTL
jgi:hypothetical protein